MAEQNQKFGVVRFGIGVDSSGLLDWTTLKRESGLKREYWRKMQRVSQEHGANPLLWFGSFEPVPVGQLTIQTWDGVNWRDGLPVEATARFTEGPQTSEDATPRLRDISQFVSENGYSENLRQNVLALETEADQIWPLVKLGDACRVLASILRCTSRQLRILQAASNLPIELAAGACRMVFEVNIRTRLVTSDPVRMKEFVAERMFDELELIKAVKTLASGEPSQAADANDLDLRMRELNDMASRHGIERPKGMSWRDRARATGVEEEYVALYGFWSNYVHGTSWLVNTTEEVRDCWQYRAIFALKTQLYAGDTLSRVREYVEKNLKQE